MSLGEEILRDRIGAARRAGPPPAPPSDTVSPPEPIRLAVTLYCSPGHVEPLIMEGIEKLLAEAVAQTGDPHAPERIVTWAFLKFAHKRVAGVGGLPA